MRRLHRAALPMLFILLLFSSIVVACSSTTSGPGTVSTKGSDPEPAVQNLQDKAKEANPAEPSPADDNPAKEVPPAAPVKEAPAVDAPVKEQPSPEVSGGGTPATKPEARSEEPKEHIVEIAGFAFQPETLEIRTGDTVTFVNKDPMGHTATADDGSFDTGLLGKDESKSVVFDTPGEFSYYCKPHPGMKGTIIVK